MPQVRWQCLKISSTRQVARQHGPRVKRWPETGTSLIAEPGRLAIVYQGITPMAALPAGPGR
jgi:hypothetical protein